MSSAIVVGDIDSRSLNKLIPSPEATACLAENVARRFQCIPLSLSQHGDASNRTLVLAIANPPDSALQERISRQLPKGIVANYSCVADMPTEQVLDKCYTNETQGLSLIKACDYLCPITATQSGESNRVVRLVEAILREACLQGASDIHLALSHGFLSVRFRIDGVLEPFARLHSEYAESVVGRIKILASLDISETRLPQDGQFVQCIEGRCIDFRVSFFPISRGENTVIRALDSAFELSKVKSAIYTDTVKSKLLACLQHPDGFIVFCGPTGSGKSTSLYALLAELDHHALNVMTLEDPVETIVPQIRQTSIDESRNFGYEEGIRAILRQDPDVILIGEVRDSPSASMMLRASMTGHRVLTTVHASDAFSAIDRLMELGLGRELLSRNIRCIVSQRLVRKTCIQCLGEYRSDCICRGKRYLGRQAIMEVISVNPTIANLLCANASKEKLLLEAGSCGFQSFEKQAKSMLEQGITDAQELCRVFGPDVIAV